VLDLYEQAQELAAQGEAVVCADEKTSIQARQRLSATKAAALAFPVLVTDRYRSMGALQLFCALMVATGLTFARMRTGRKFADFKAFLLEFFQSALCQGLKVIHLVLDNGSTHAPKQLGSWIASLNLPFEVRIYWLPAHASWLDQVEIVFSKVQRDVLTPNDFASTIALEKTLKEYFADLNRYPRPIHWTYTKTKLLAKFAPPQGEREYGTNERERNKRKRAPFRLFRSLSFVPYSLFGFTRASECSWCPLQERAKCRYPEQAQAGGP
jgi:DDE superfamily endonuclease